MRWKTKLTAFFFDEFDPASMGLFRIIFGLFLIIMFIALFPNWNTYYGRSGLRPDPVGGLEWSIFLLFQNELPIFIYWWIGFFAACAFTLGWKTRMVTVILFIIQTSMNHANPMMVNGEDLVIRMLMFYGIFSPLGFTYSLDRLFTKNDCSRPCLVWPLRLMQINIALIYAFSLPIKLASDPSWWNGEALYWVMMTSTWNRWPWQKLFYNGILSKIMTVSTVIVEGLFPILVWFRPTQIPLTALIALFHIGLGLALQNVTFFSFSMVCSFVLFIPGSKIRLFIQKIENLSCWSPLSFAELGKPFARDQTHLSN
jgi:hypothetical protein